MKINEFKSIGQSILDEINLEIVSNCRRFKLFDQKNKLEMSVCLCVSQFLTEDSAKFDLV